MQNIPLQAIIVLASIASATVAVIMGEIDGDIYAVIITAALAIAGGSSAAIRGVQNGTANAVQERALLDAAADKVADKIRRGEA